MKKLKNPKLTIRMKLFLEFTLKGEDFWDICCDHGYVGIGALKSNEYSNIHFVDQVPQIMERLSQLLKQTFLRLDEINCHLHVLPAESLDEEIKGNVLIAGVGGLTIKTILDTLLQSNKLKAKRIILSPHTDEAVLINYMISAEFQNFYKINSKEKYMEIKKCRTVYILDALSVQ